jgi:hypothetical protein
VSGKWGYRCLHSLQTAIYLAIVQHAASAEQNRRQPAGSHGIGGAIGKVARRIYTA